ncbi:MAG: hypothetical protein R3F60_23160 [bacterium]
MPSTALCLAGPLALALGLGCLLPGAAHAGPPGGAVQLEAGFVAERWTREDGIPVNGLTDVAQTADGMIWLATYGGLVRFDGLRFEVMDLSRAHLPANVFTGLAVAPDGWLWAATENHGLVSLRGGEVSGHPQAATAFIEQADGLWIGTPGGLFDARDGQLVPLSPPSPHTILAACRDADGRLWLGADQGHLLRVEGDRLVAGPRVTGADGEPVDVLALAHDGARLWVGSQAGLFLLDGGQLVAHPSPRSLAVHALVADGDGFIAGTQTGPWRMTRGEGRPLPGAEAPPFSALRRPGLRLPGGALLTLDRHALVRDGLPVATTTAPLTALLVGRRGALWLTTMAGELIRLQPRDIELLPGSEGNTYGLLEDRQGDVWVASLGGPVRQLRGGRSSGMAESTTPGRSPRPPTGPSGSATPACAA